jgi:type I protein arginine methyltransferase
MSSRGVSYAVDRLYAASMRSRTIRDAVYQRWNADEFTDLFEHEKMLADRVRVRAYHEAITRQIRPDDVVVDLGTGTGILAMFVARVAKRVYAVDHSDFIEVAEAVARHHGFRNITFVQEHSGSFTPPEQVDVVVHEQMGDELTNEDMITNLLDLRHRILAEGGRILPSRFELFVEPDSLTTSAHVPHLWELEVEGIDFGFLGATTLLEPYQRRRYGRRRVTCDEVSQLLSDPAPVVSFDLDVLPDASVLPREVGVTRRATRAGSLDGYLVYFRAIFDERTALSTSPDAPQTSWRNRFLRTPRRDVVPGDDLSYTVQFPDLRRPSTWSVAPLVTDG